MLFIKSFANYEEFKEIFGVREFEGRKARNNKILLSLLKERVILRNVIKTNDFTLLSINNMTDLKNTVLKKVSISGARSKKLKYKLTLLGRNYYSAVYSLDQLNGICEDGTASAVRYVNNESCRVFKMKSGKMMRHLIESTKIGKLLPEQVKNWLCEEFTRDWTSYSMGKLPKNKLVVNDDFAGIYSSDRLKKINRCCCFGSCMTDKDQHYFYENAVKAKAAYLEDSEGDIIARCVIFTEVFDEDGNVYRYAERQYSSGGNEVYKQALVDALINAGEIDCYKTIGASCHDNHAIVDINGNSLSNKNFHIHCDLDWDDTLSYQDTFKYYNMSTHKADNYGAGNLDLATTDSSLDYDDEDHGEWDSYHECYVDEITYVYFHGNEITCDSEVLGDFEYVFDEWYHKDDLLLCPICGEYLLNPEYYGKDDTFHSSVTNEYYCCEKCRKLAEERYINKTLEEVKEKEEEEAEKEEEGLVFVLDEKY